MSNPIYLEKMTEHYHDELMSIYSRALDDMTRWNKPIPSVITMLRRQYKSAWMIYMDALDRAGFSEVVK